MNTLDQQVEEWKALQMVRLPKVALPCRHCQGEAEVQFDPSETCPRCGQQFLGKPAQARRLTGPIIALLCLGLAAVGFGGFIVVEKIALQLGLGSTFQIVVALAVIFPFVGYMLKAAAGSAFEGVRRTAQREIWVQYTQAVVGAIPSGHAHETLAWLYARSLFAPFFEDHAADNAHRAFVSKYKKTLSPEIELLLRDLIWVNCLLCCAHTSGYWNPYSSAFNGYGSDRATLVDFVERIKKTNATEIKRTDGYPLLWWIDDSTPPTAPQLKRSLKGRTVAFSEMHEAVRSGNIETAKALLGKNPDLVLIEDIEGDTALHWAAGAGHRELTELLVANNAGVNANGAYRETPLHWAAGKGHREVAELLLDAKADVNPTDADGRTPLHHALFHDSPHAVARLLGREYSQEGCKAVAALLRQHGGTGDSFWGASR